MSQWSQTNQTQNEPSKSYQSALLTPTIFDGARNTFVIPFRDNSKKFVTDILTKNFVLNFSGALFLVGLGCSLRWWYKDQLSLVLLKQNLPAFSEPKQKISWETGEYLLKKQNRSFVKKNNPLTKSTYPRETAQTTKWMDESPKFSMKLIDNKIPNYRSLIERVDLYTNCVFIKFKPPWQKHVNQRFIGVFAEPTQINEQKIDRHTIKIKGFNTTCTALPTSLVQQALEEGRSTGFSSFPTQYESHDSLLTFSEGNEYSNAVMRRMKQQPTAFHTNVKKLGDVQPIESQKQQTPCFVKNNKIKTFYPTTKSYTSLRENDATYTTWKPLLPETWFKLSARGLGIFGNQVSIKSPNKVQFLALLQTKDKQIWNSFKEPTVNFFDISTERNTSLFNSSSGNTSGKVGLKRSFLPPFPTFLAQVIQSTGTVCKSTHSVENQNSASIEIIREGKIENYSFGYFKDSSILSTKFLKLQTLFKKSKLFVSINPHASSLLRKTNADNSVANINTLKDRCPNITNEVGNVSNTKMVGAENDTAFKRHFLDKSVSICKTQIIDQAKISYPLELTKTMAGWRPPIDTLVLNSLLDEIPFKLESAFPSVFLKKDSELVARSLSFINSINPSKAQLDCSAFNTRLNKTEEKVSETFRKKLQLIELKQLVKHELQFLIESLSLKFVENQCFQTLSKSRKDVKPPINDGRQVQNTKTIENSDWGVKKGKHNNCTTKGNNVVNNVSTPFTISQGDNGNATLSLLDTVEVGNEDGTALETEFLNSYETPEPFNWMWFLDSAKARDGNFNDQLFASNLLTNSVSTAAQHPNITNEVGNVGTARPPVQSLPSSMVQIGQVEQQPEEIKKLVTSTINIFNDTEGIKSHTHSRFHDSLSVLNTLGFTFNNLSSLKSPFLLLPINKNASFWTWKLPFNARKKDKNNLCVSPLFERLQNSALLPSKRVAKQHSNKVVGFDSPILTNFFHLYKRKSHLPFSLTNKVERLQAGTTSNTVYCSKPTNLTWKLYQHPSYPSYYKFILNFCAKNGKSKKITFGSSIQNWSPEKLHKKISSNQKYQNVSGSKTIIKQKKVSIANLECVNQVDKQINFVTQNSRCMSGFVYPDTQNSLLRENIYQWIAKSKTLFSMNKGLQDTLVTPNDIVSTLLYPDAFQTPSGIAKSLDNVCLHGVEIPMTSSTFLFRFFSVNPSDVNLETLMSWKTEEKRKNSCDSTLTISELPPVQSLLQIGQGVQQAIKDCNDGITKPSIFSFEAQTGSDFHNRNMLGPVHLHQHSEEQRDLLHTKHKAKLPYKKFQHRLASFPGFTQPNRLLGTLQQISQGDDKAVLSKEFERVSISSTMKNLSPSFAPALLAQQDSGLQNTMERVGEVDTLASHPDLIFSDSGDEKKKGYAYNGESQIIRNSRFGLGVKKDLIDYNARGVAYSGIVVQRNQLTKDFQPSTFPSVPSVQSLPSSMIQMGMIGHPHSCASPLFESLRSSARNVKDNHSSQWLQSTGNQPSKLADLKESSVWGTFFLGPENPLTTRQCHFFGQKQFSPLDTNKYQRDYLRELGKEVITQSNSKGFSEKLPSIERTKVLSFSKSANSFLLKKRKYAYLLEKRDQWHLLFQEQLRNYLEDIRLSTKYPPLTPEERKDHSAGRLKISAPLMMVRFPKESRKHATSYQKRPNWALLNPTRREQDILHVVQSIDGSNSISNVNGDKAIKPAFSFNNSTGEKDPQNESCMRSSDAFLLQKVPDKGKNSERAVPMPLTHKVRKIQHGLSWRPFCYFETSRLTTLNTVNPSTLPNSLVQLVMLKNLETPFLSPALSRWPHKKAELPEINIADKKLGSSMINGEGVLPITTNATAFSPYSQHYSIPQIVLHYPLFTERQGLELNTTFLLNKYARFTPNLGWIIQEPLTAHSWTVVSQWFFLVALLFWIEQILLGDVFPALSALEQVLLGSTGVKTGDRAHTIRISKGDKPKFQDLAGINGLLGELSELVLFLRGQQFRLGNTFTSFFPKGDMTLSGKRSHGVILTGSPGTGKTFLVRALANEARVPVLILSASTLLANKQNNNKPSWSIRHAFRRAKQLAPCILFIDEIDALGKSRGKIVTDINEIITDAHLNSPGFPNTPSQSRGEKSTNLSTHGPSSLASRGNTEEERLFNYEQFLQNWPSASKLLTNEWEYPLKSLISRELNKVNRESLCEEKILNLFNQERVLRSMNSSDRTQGVDDKAIGMIIQTEHNLSGFNQGNSALTKSGVGEHGDTGLAKQSSESKRKFGPLTQLLVSMDGVNSLSGILIMGATNRPELLDPALIRPGRFERMIRIEKPSEQKRIEIMKLYSQNLGVQNQIRVPWSYFANRTRGFTAADLAVAMNYSSLKAILQGSTHTIKTIEYGLDCITRHTVKPKYKLKAQRFSMTHCTNQLRKTVRSTEIGNVGTVSTATPNFPQATNTIQNNINFLINKSSTKSLVENFKKTNSIGSAAKHYKGLLQMAYYQAGKIVVQTFLPQHPPVSLITIDLLGGTQSTAADASMPIENTQCCSSLESRLIGLYGGKAASLLFEHQYRMTRLIKQTKEPINKSVALPSQHDSLLTFFEGNEYSNYSKTSVQSNIGTIEIQAATRLAMTMVNYWGLYSCAFPSFQSVPSKMVMIGQQDHCYQISFSKPVFNSIDRSYTKSFLPLFASGHSRPMLSSKQVRKKTNDDALNFLSPLVLASRSKNSLKLSGKSNVSYSHTRVSVEDVGERKGSQIDVFQLVNPLQFSNIQRNCFYLSWFRLYLPDIEATQFLKNVTNFYFNLGLQTIVRVSTIDLLIKAIQMFPITFSYKDNQSHLKNLFFCCGNNNLSIGIGLLRGAAKRRSNFSIKSQYVLNSAHSSPSNHSNLRLDRLNKGLTVPLVPRWNRSPIYTEWQTSSYPNISIPFWGLLKPYNIHRLINIGFRQKTSAPSVQSKIGILQNAGTLYRSTIAAKSTISQIPIITNLIEQVKLNRLVKKVDKKFDNNSVVTRKDEKGAMTLRKKRSYMERSEKRGTQQDLLSSLLLERQIFSTNFDTVSIGENELIFQSLVNNCFAEAFFLIKQNRQLIDYFVDYLIRFQVLRQHQIFYIFSTLLLHCKKPL